MPKVYRIPLLLLITIVGASFCLASWIPFAVDERLSVKMPSVPKEMQTATGKAYFCEGSTANYVVMRTLFSHIYTDSERDQYYSTVVATFQNEGKGKLLERSIFKVGSYSGVEFVVKIVHPATRKAGIMCVRFLLVDSVAYTLQYLPVDVSKYSKAERAPFFTSIILKTPLPSPK